jgi:hypothetical protein
VFHVIDPQTQCHLFLLEDPRADGFVGEVQEGVTMTQPPDLNRWPDGADRPSPCLGVSPAHATVYRGFHSRQECEDAGYTPLVGSWLALPRWSRRPWATN